MSQGTSGSRFVMLNALLSARLSKRVGTRLSAHGISLTEYLIMHHLANSPLQALPRIELAEHIGMSASGITRLLAPMEKLKLVEKEANPRDARQSLVRLSGTGQRVLEEASVSFEHIADSLVDNLSQSQLERLVDHCSQLL